MLVLGCDPGQTESAWVLYSHADRDLLALNPNARSLVTHYGQGANAEVVTRIQYHAMQGRPGVPTVPVVIEMPANYGPAKGGAPLYMTAYWAGVFAHACDPRPNQPGVVRVTRPEIVLHWCGARSGFTKAQVAAAVAERLWGLTTREAKGTVKSPGPVYGFKGYHLWDALELAAWYAETIDLPKRKA